MANKTQSTNVAFSDHDHRQCQQHLLDAARQLCEVRKLRWTPRRQEVLEVLLGSHQPMGAYEILTELNQANPDDQIAPPIVYRALEFLLEQGMIHRIESRNAFISCVHPGHQCAAQFLICRNCEQVAELENNDQTMLAEADNLGFEVDHSVIEITGVCAECRKHA